MRPVDPNNDPVEALLAPFTRERRLGAALSQALGVLSIGVAIAIGIAIWVVLSRVLFSPIGSFFGLGSTPSYAVSLLFFTGSQYLAFKGVILSWHGARDLVVSVLVSSNTLRSPLGQFALGLFVGRRRRRD